MTNAVTDHFLRELVTGSHAEGNTCLAVAAVIEDDGRTLLVATAGDELDTVWHWQLPTDLVEPGETLVQGLVRTVSLTTGLGVVDVTGYGGHHDRLIDGDVVRTFVFTVTVDDPERVCRWANIGHCWSADPITTCSLLGEVTGCPADAADPAARLIGPTTLHQLSTALREAAKGLLCSEAAIELLIKQRSWLSRHDFVGGFLDRWIPPSRDPAGSAGIAFVDWGAALAALDDGRLPCSSGEGQLLRIAASLAEGLPVDLRDAITGLDAVNSRLVARAVCHAAGHRP